MLFVIRMLRIGWRVLAQRDWASFPNESAILRRSANGIIWKHLLEKKVSVGLRFGARLALPSPADISLGACCQSSYVMVSDVIRSMDEKNVGALPVVDKGTLVGIVSERD
jgi:hypothetical protein